MNLLKKTLYILFFIALGFNAYCLEKEVSHDKKDPSLVVISMSDIHARVEPDYEYKDNEIFEIAGFSRIKAYIDNQREKYSNKLLVTASGDYLVEDYKNGEFVETYKGKAIFSLMNDWNIDIATLGNHEFDFGEDFTLQSLKYCKFPIVITNIDYLPKKSPNCHKEYIIEKNGYKIGFLGLITEELNGYRNYEVSIPNIKLDEDVISSTQKAVDDLIKKTDLVIVLSHLGLEEDKKLASQVSGIDIICGGHSHDKTEIEEIVLNPLNEKTVITHTGEYTQNLGVIKLFEKNNKIHSYYWELNKMDSSIIKDKDMELKISKYRTDMPKSEVIAHSDNILDSKKATLRTQESILANIFTDCYKNAYDDVDISLINGNCIRGGRVLPPGDITEDYIDKTTFEVNKLVKLKLKGKHIRQVLEHGVSLLPNKSKFLLHGSGIRYTVDLFKKPQKLKKDSNGKYYMIEENGERITSIDILGKDNKFYPIEGDKVYSIVSNSLTIGKYNNASFIYQNNAESIDNLDIYEKDFIIKEFKKLKTVSSKIDGRIKILNDKVN